MQGIPQSGPEAARPQLFCHSHAATSQPIPHGLMGWDTPFGCTHEAKARTIRLQEGRSSHTLVQLQLYIIS
jgi:hypothetical protein